PNRPANLAIFKIEQPPHRLQVDFGLVAIVYVSIEDKLAQHNPLGGIAVHPFQRVVNTSRQSGDDVLVVRTTTFDMSGLLEQYKSRIDRHLVLFCESLAEFTRRHFDLLETKRSDLVINATNQFWWRMITLEKELLSASIGIVE